MGFFEHLSLPWLLVYITTLFLFDLSPGVSFVLTAKNTIKNKSLKIGLFTALGVASSDGLTALIGFFFCTALNTHKMLFGYCQALGVCYLMYVGMKMFTSKTEKLSLEGGVSMSKQKWEAYKSGFLCTFSNIGIAVVIVSVMSQFYDNVSHWYGYFGLLIMVPVISFLSFASIACCCYFLKLWWLFSKYAGLLDKIAGVVIIILATTNIKEILPLLK